MTTDIETDRRANLVGSTWMVAAMAGFAFEDVFVKAASAMLPVSQILIILGLGGAFVFACIATLRGERLFRMDVISRLMRFRMLFEIFGRLFYMLAIALTPLSVATVILQATPIVVVAGAALVFREKVGWRRWTAIFVGLLGVVVIIRPGTDSFSMLSIAVSTSSRGVTSLRRINSVRAMASNRVYASDRFIMVPLYSFVSNLENERYARVRKMLDARCLILDKTK